MGAAAPFPDELMNTSVHHTPCGKIPHISTPNFAVGPYTSRVLFMTGLKWPEHLYNKTILNFLYSFGSHKGITFLFGFIAISAKTFITNY